jgi:hypothetical protein
MKTHSQEKKDQLKEGVHYGSFAKKYIARVKMKDGRLTSLIAFKKEKDALEYYENWIKENKIL